MDEPAPEFDVKELEAMNEKALRNTFFTPDRCYFDLSLFKDFNIGAINAKFIESDDGEAFALFHAQLQGVIEEYQKRTFDTIDPYLTKFGFTDSTIHELLQNSEKHDRIFLSSPATYFIQFVVRHLARNQNNSRPAFKYIKKKIDANNHTIEPIDVVFRINTYPLMLSPRLLDRIGQEYGELFGVNMEFMCKDPRKFDLVDWNTWMSQVDCFYVNNISWFLHSDMIRTKQEEFAFMGCYLFTRKQFDGALYKERHTFDFDQEIQRMYGRLSLLFDFEWIQNNDVRLTEQSEDNPMIEESDKPLYPAVKG